MLHKASKLRGTTVRARDGDIGTVQDVYLDDEQWRVRYLAVKTGPGLTAKVVLLPPAAVEAAWNTAAVPVALTRSEVSQAAPDVLPDDRHLVSSRELEGCHIQATDGEIGHVDDLLLDEQSWGVRYLVLDTSNWIGGRAVVISPRALASVDWPDRLVKLDVARDEVKRSPLLDSVDLGPGEDAPPFAII